MRFLKCTCGKCPTCYSREWARSPKGQAYQKAYRESNKAHRIAYGKAYNKKLKKKRWESPETSIRLTDTQIKILNSAKKQNRSIRNTHKLTRKEKKIFYNLLGKYPEQTQKALLLDGKCLERRMKEIEPKQME